MNPNDVFTLKDLRQKFSWQSIKQQPKRGLALLAILITLGSLTVEVTTTCITAVTKPLELPHISDNWKIADSSVDAEIIWQRTFDFQTSQYPHYINANQHMVNGHDKVFYLWSGGHISGFPCFRNDQLFLTYDLTSGDLLNQYDGKETSDLRSMKATDDGFAVVSYDHALTQFDESGNFVWSNQQFFSHSIKNIFETDELYYLPTRWDAYIVEKADGHKHHSLSNPDIIAVYEDIIIQRGKDTSIQIVDREDETIFSSVHFPITTDGFGYAPFITHHENLLIFTQLHEQVRAYDLDTQTFIWTLETPYLEHEYPTIAENTVILYNAPTASLELYDSASGKFIGDIHLKNKGNDSHPAYVDVAVEGDIITVFFQNTHDLIAIKADFTHEDA